MDDQRINEHKERDKDKSAKRGKRSENTDTCSTRGESTPSSLWFPSGTWLLSPGPWRPLEGPPPAWKVAGEAGPQRSGPGARHTDSLPGRWGLVRGGGGAGSPGPGLSWPPCSPRAARGAAGTAELHSQEARGMGLGTVPTGGEEELTRAWLGVWSQEDSDHQCSQEPRKKQGEWVWATAGASASQTEDKPPRVPTGRTKNSDFTQSGAGQPSTSQGAPARRVPTGPLPRRRGAL